MNREKTVMLPTQHNDVIAYADDIFAWAYLDQEDGLIRYEAYVIGYDDWGLPATLQFVFEEGAFNLEHLPVVQHVWREADGKPFTDAQWDALHAAFAAEEESLKRTRRAQWIRRLRALGYDVIANR